MDAVVVVKIGGGALGRLDAVARDAAALLRKGRTLVLVHGGSVEMDELSRRLGQEPCLLTSPSGHVSRRTDQKTLDVFLMAYCGLVNKRLVERLRREGVDAMGLCGIDAGLWRARRKQTVRAVVDGRIVVVRDDYTGVVEQVDAERLKRLLDMGVTPVLTPPAVSERSEAVNVDADRAAAATAAALGASELALLTAAPGLLRDPADPASLLASLTRSDRDIALQAAQGRMKRKVLAAFDALEQGVGRVVIGDSRGEAPIRAALAREGTVIQ